MAHKFFNICLSQFNLWTKILLVLAIIVMGAVFAFIIRMHQGPINLGFIKPQIEAALSQDNMKVTIGALGLTWPSLTEPILFDVNNVQVMQEDQEGLKIENAAFSLSSLALLRAKISPKYVLIDRPVIHLVQRNGTLGFMWSSDVKPQENSPQENLIQENLSEQPEQAQAQQAQVKEKPQKEQDIDIKKTRNDVRVFLGGLLGADSDSVFSNLEQIELKQAIVKGQGANNKQEDYLALVDLKLEKNDLGLQGNLNATLPSTQGVTASLKSDVVVRAAEKDLTFTADLKGFNPAHFAPFFQDDIIFTQQDFLLNGKVQAAFDQDFQLQTAMMNLNVPEGNVNYPDLYDAPIPLKDIRIDAHLNRLEKTLDIKKFEATVNDIAFTASALGKRENGTLILPVTLKMDALPVNNVEAIFPKSLSDTSGGRWATKKLKNGRFTDVALKATVNVSKNPETNKRDVSVSGFRADFKADGVTVKYSDTLKPVTDVVGTGYYEDDVLVIKGTSGKIGDIISRDVDLKMSDLTVKGGGIANIKVKARGPLKTALQYASDEPIGLGDDLGFDVNKVKGMIDFDLTLNFPTIKELKAEQVKVVIEGKVTDLVLPQIVKGLDLTGGPYDLAFKEGAITLKGKGALGGYPASVDWMQYLDSKGKEFESKVTASLTSDKKLRDVFGIGLEDYISGALPINVVYTDFGKKAVIDFKGDLTPTAIHIAPLGYKKSGGVAGDLRLKAYLNGQDIQNIDGLTLKTKDFTLPDGRLGFRKLKDGSVDVSNGSFPNAKLGKTQSNINFEITNDNILKIIANGSVIDIEPFLESKKEVEVASKDEVTEERAMIVSASAPRVLAKAGEALKNTKIYLETDTDNDITHLEIDSDIGNGEMYIRFKPEDETGKRTFRMESSDAGYTLKAFGLYDKMRGGKITIYGVPQGGDLTGDLFGSARIDNFRVRSAPALAKLLGAMSLNGANDLLRNDGVSFARLESDFEWQFRDQGNFLVVKEGRTSGSSLGLTFDGSVDQATNQMNLKGTIVPVSGVNNAIGNIPLIGNILTGGDALIAATYTMAGPTSDPKVSVNPLSVLAPGFLRKILFEGSAPKSNQKQVPSQAPSQAKDQIKGQAKDQEQPQEKTQEKIQEKIQGQVPSMEQIKSKSNVNQ